MVWPRLKVFWFSKDNHTGHSERKKKKMQREDEVGRQYQRVDISGRQSMGCAPVRRDNPRALARGLSTVQAHKPCSISLVPQ